MRFSDTRHRVAIRFLSLARWLAPENAVLQKIPIIFGVNRVVRVELRMVAVRMMFHVRVFKNAIRLRKWNDG